VTADPYDLLGVNHNANREVIDAAYKALLKMHHPDRATDESDRQIRERLCQEMGQAHHLLSDPVKRAKLDDQRRRAATSTFEQPRNSTPDDRGSRTQNQPRTPNASPTPGERRAVPDMSAGTSHRSDRRTQPEARTRQRDWDDLSAREKSGLRHGARRSVDYQIHKEELLAARVRLGRWIPAAWLAVHRASPRPRRKPGWKTLVLVSVLAAIYGVGTFALRASGMLSVAFGTWDLNFANLTIPVPEWTAAGAALSAALSMSVAVLTWRLLAPALSERRGATTRGALVLTCGAVVLAVAEYVIALSLLAGIAAGGLWLAWWLIKDFILQDRYTYYY
jgi:curved DNA-binding protein CbpA